LTTATYTRLIKCNNSTQNTNYLYLPLQSYPVLFVTSDYEEFGSQTVSTCYYYVM